MRLPVLPEASVLVTIPFIGRSPVTASAQVVHAPDEHTERESHVSPHAPQFARCVAPAPVCTLVSHPVKPTTSQSEKPVLHV
jgi:hypothetical protein